jgi:hypothetical protein
VEVINRTTNNRTVVDINSHSNRTVVGINNHKRVISNKMVVVDTNKIVVGISRKVTNTFSLRFGQA